MGNEMEKSLALEGEDTTSCDFDSTAAVGPGPLMTHSISADESEVASPNSYSAKKTQQESLNPSQTVDSAAAVGPLFTMKDSTSTDDDPALSTAATLLHKRTASTHTTTSSVKTPNRIDGPFSPQRRHKYSSSIPSGKVPSPVNVGNELEIEDDTPAAAALEANAAIKVGKVGKAARYVNAQTIKRLITQTRLYRRKTGNKRGKPPRVPEISRRWSDNDIQIDIAMEQIREEEEREIEEASPSSPHPLDSKEFSSSDFRKVASPQEEQEEDDTQYVAYDTNNTPTITLHDKHGKRQKVKLFEKMTKSSSKRKEKKSARNYVKGKVIEEKHELYTLSIAVMLGLRYAIYQTHRQLENDKRDKRFWLDSEEFMRMEKYVFRPDGRKNTPPHKLGHTFKFKDYSPVPFAYIRRMFGINEYEFIHSVCGNANFIEFISNAKSGQFFFYSSDGKYMIKTMTNTESKFLRRILPHYFRHCAQNPSTLMTKFLGMYRVKLYHLQRNVKFVVMNSVFDTDKMISSFYDLKGSRIGRDAKQGESVKKDNDVRRMVQKDPNSGFLLPPSVRTRVREQLRRDCNFLKEMKIMDYSMLIGVHYIPSKSAGKSGDSIRGLVFRDSESVRSASRKSKLINMANKPSYNKNLQRARSDSGPGSPMNSKTFLGGALLFSGSVLSPPTLNSSDQAKSSSKKVEFQLDESVFSDELLEEKPAEVSYVARARSPFSLTELDSRLVPGDHSVLSASTLGFDEEDEFTAIDNNRQLPIRDDILNSPLSDENSNIEWKKERLDVDLRREAAIEQSYWPFHRYYEINGQRRVIPIDEKYRNTYEDDLFSHFSDANCASCLGNPNNYDPDLAASRVKWQLKDFEKPLSNRKDGGFLMDTKNINLPMKVIQNQECDGKIFYMGVIDILQQFNVRKRMEARYRRIKGGGWDGASCVHPDFYAERFLQFFDEYTQRQGYLERNEAPSQYTEEEQILFSTESNSLRTPMN